MLTNTRETLHIHFLTGISVITVIIVRFLLSHLLLITTVNNHFIQFTDNESLSACNCNTQYYVKSYYVQNDYLDSASLVDL